MNTSQFGHLNLRCNGAGDILCDFFLQVEDVLQLTIITLSPDMSTVGAVNELSRDPNPVSSATDAAFKYVVDAEIATDLEKMLCGYLEIFNSTPLATVIPSLAGERTHNPELSELFDPVSKARRQPLIRALERGVKRGELLADLDVELAADLIVGPIAVALFFKGGKPSPRMVEPIIDLALRGMRR